MVAGVAEGVGPALRGVLPVIVASAVLLAACGGEDEPELTFEDRLVELEGRPLTPAEVAERAEIGQAICLLDDPILDELWQQLSDEQLDFQDIVIADLCPERAVLYAGHTGRFVTDEAEESGVRTSTTRPTSSRPTGGPTTTRPGTTSTGPGGASTGSTDTGSSTPSSTTTSSRPTTSTTTTTTTVGSTSR